MREWARREEAGWEVAEDALEVVQVAPRHCGSRGWCGRRAQRSGGARPHTLATLEREAGVDIRTHHPMIH